MAPRDTQTKHVRPAPLALALAAVICIAALTGCPQERPGAEREIPPQRIPPAVAVDPQPAPGAALAPDGGVTRRP